VVALIQAAIIFQASARATTPDGFPVIDQPRVLIVSFDGLRPDAITAATAPTLTDLIASGSYDAAALAEIPAVTLPNHLCMAPQRGSILLIPLTLVETGRRRHRR